MPTAPFPVDPVLTGIAIAYRNAAYIADDVLPRVPVARKEFKWWDFSVGEGFTIPDTLVGRKSVPNEVELSGEEKPSYVHDYGLDDVIPNDDIDNAPEGYNPVDRAVQQLTDYVLLDREVRTAGLVFNTSSYHSSCKTTLSTAADKWSDYTSSDPIDDIMQALDAPLMRPNIGVFGQAVWTKLIMHPRIVKAVHGNSGDSGIARRQQIADLFELEEVLVGSSRLNTARKGQSPTLARVWGNSAAFLHRNRMADTNSGLTFGFTAEYGTRVAGTLDEPKVGLRGSKRVRTGESLRELIVANQAGFLIDQAI